MRAKGIPNKNTIALIGQRFGRLLVVGLGHQVFNSDGLGTWYLRCLCDCGQITFASPFWLRRSIKVSCGCYMRDNNRKLLRRRMTIHGEGNHSTPEYRAWGSMKSRCKPNHAQSKDYIQRGITVCEEWLHSYESFLGHIGRRPSPEYSLDRIDNNRGYEPGNVRWATKAEQTASRRKRGPNKKKSHDQKVSRIDDSVKSGNKNINEIKRPRSSVG